jgi:hypothetical protein
MAAYAPSIPSKLNLAVRETAGIARSGEVVRSGVPMPRALNLKSAAGLTLVDGGGARVPAEFEVTARWNAGLADTTAPIQWMLVTFPATVAARGTSIYRVVTDGSAGPNPAPARPLTVSQSGNAVTVDTGAAIFRLGADSTALFDEMVLDNGTRLATGGNGLTLKTNGGNAGHSTTRKVWVEHAGPLTAIVVVEGQYDTAPIGDAGIASRRRYVFTAGSGTAIVRQSAVWEGTLIQGCPDCLASSSGVVNGVLVQQLQDRLVPQLGGTPTVTAVGSFGAPAVVKSVGSGQSAWVRQQLRANRSTPLAFDVNVAGSAAAGGKADGGLLAASGPRGTLAIALERMHRYEPQALRLSADGSLAVDLADDKVWIANHQGLFATLAVAALPGTAPRAQLDQQVWAPLNRPLHAWPEAAWFAASDAVREFPAAGLPADFAAYDSTIAGVLTRTLDQVDSLGTAGLQTYGLFPRYWGKYKEPGEIDCGGGDPTPSDAWDNTFWCSTWTDYHMTSETAVVRAMRTGEVDWLDEIATPAARRMLHTQILQCGPDDHWFYCGQAPAGYGGYRSDFNSSHAYWENLFLYYWLTGDHTVIDTIQRGGDHMRRYMCPQRGGMSNPQASLPSGAMCAPDSPVTTGLNGRVGSQWIAAFRFLGLASNDGTFLDDYRGSLARAVTNYYVELRKNNVSYGFFAKDSAVGKTSSTTDQIWMSSFYDMENLFRLQSDTGDAPIGIPAIPPSRVIAGFARFIRDLVPTVAGDGTIQGQWPLMIDFNWSGSRLGGNLLTTVMNNNPEPLMYTPEKAADAALLVRAGQQTGDSSLIQMGLQLSKFVLSAADGEQAPLGKLEGQDLTLLHAGIARLADGSGSAPGPVPPPTPTPTPTPPPPPPPPTPTPTPPPPPIPTPPPPPPPPTPAPGVPAAPSGLIAQQLPGNLVKLTWKDNAGNETGFRIEMLLSGAWKELRAVGADVTSFYLSGWASGVQHTVRVRAVNNAGYSAYSNTASTLP